MIDTFAGPKTVRNVARLIIRDVRSRFGFHTDALMLKPALTPQEAFACGRGECNSIADIHVLALRAMGIAATKDMIPMWGTSDGGHVEAVYFDEDGNPVMLDTGDWLAAQPPKIYREEFSLPALSAAKAENIFGDPHYRDVTAEYVATSDVALTFDSGPAVLAEPTEETSAERYRFNGIGRGILYLPVWVGADRRSVRVAGRPGGRQR